jgi:hypothetical protein
MMENDKIYAPHIISFALEHLWKKLDAGEISSEAADAAIKQLGEWVSTCARAKPGEFWQGVF